MTKSAQTPTSAGTLIDTSSLLSVAAIYFRYLLSYATTTGTPGPIVALKVTDFTY